MLSSPYEILRLRPVLLLLSEVYHWKSASCCHWDCAFLASFACCTMAMLLQPSPHQWHACMSWPLSSGHDSGATCSLSPDFFVQLRTNEQ